jgi:NAD(P)-dependent dehydrogenase (short-subunit alcohol dehydrogenase family)
MNDMDNLRGKTVWVVGGATGIGFATARLLGKRGARVVLSGRRKIELDKAIDTLGAAGIDALAEQCDVASIDQVEQAVAQIRQRAGIPQVLVHAAGINVPNRHWNTLDARSFSRVIDVNLKGVGNVLATVLPLMRQAGGGSIAIVSSWAGWRYASFTGPAYSASKMALASIVETVNEQEAKNGIRATLVCPGEVATPILASRPVPPSQQDMDRMLQPEDVADAIGFAVSAPPHVCLNELVISPLWNRMYLEPERLKG